MSLHPSTFEYLKATNVQAKAMDHLRTAAATYAAEIDAVVPDGADKTYILRRVRETAMWINVTLMREADGTPRR